MHDGCALPHAQVIQEILALVYARTGTNFLVYRRATVARRIKNRMISLGIEDGEEYLAKLRRDVDETFALVARITIKVSRFYRNAVTFDHLRATVLPRLAEEARSRPLRIWSAGCALGEEAYTLAMLLDEMGRNDVVEATDVDPMALVAARRGTYAAEALVELPEELRDRYMNPRKEKGRLLYEVDGSLRTRVRFSRHDLLSEPSLLERGEFDLVCCRNVLIYLQRAVQERTLATLLSALRPGGYLCLGEAEWPVPNQSSRFSALARKTRIFRVGGREHERDVA